MIFVDTNVFMYAVGRPHPLRDTARRFLAECIHNATPLCTSAEVVQELVHAYLPVARLQALDRALSLITRARVEVWSLEHEDVTLARQLHELHPTLGARDLCHLASCRRRGVREVRTFDQALGAIAGVSAE
ncbi:MAG: type II toxin-antitoxin system VapC family toxin [Holophagales bacterium]|nr:type II toxin-antitoxin system VapC family toxin [Holophagales bacterium]MYG29837.1 type II toxin-antitoxin system VapC family toxin [Holophagales bacterium]MYI79251.1 type II toxin-antitoxin system VapC family toxin [Holophagales bacterium]